jgi:hypothetical protein
LDAETDVDVKDIEVEESVLLMVGGGLKQAQPLEILELRDLQPLAMAVGVGVAMLAWKAEQNAGKLLSMARRQLS